MPTQMPADSWLAERRSRRPIDAEAKSLAGSCGRPPKDERPRELLATTPNARRSSAERCQRCRRVHLHFTDASVAAEANQTKTDSHGRLQAWPNV